MSSLKRISPEAVPRALDLAERYRLLNEPEQAASICHDVLEIEPNNQDALRTLMLATTEQFTHSHGPGVEEAEKLASKMAGDYERAYYGGIACERWARAKLHTKAHTKMAGEWLRRAMSLYERAEVLRAPGNDDAMLRWNACARLVSRIPELTKDEEDFGHFGD